MAACAHSISAQRTETEIKYETEAAAATAETEAAFATGPRIVQIFAPPPALTANEIV